jgi:dipeptidyl aminopeptidase/acylaminoacyl peptidase
MNTKNLMKRLAFLGLVLLSTPAALGAQVAGKRPLDHDAYDIWKRISSRALADNGDWIAFTTSPGEGDGYLTLRSVGDRTARIVEIDRGSAPLITSDSRFLIFTIDPMHAVVDSLQDVLETRWERRNLMPKDSLAVVDLSGAFEGGSFDDGYFRAERVRSWRIPAEEGSFLAYRLESMEEEPDWAEEGRRWARRVERAEPGAVLPTAVAEELEEEQEERQAQGDTLVFRNLRSGEESRFVGVTDYAFTENGRWLVYAGSGGNGGNTGVFAVSTSSGETTAILTGEGEYKGLSLSEDGSQVAFLTDRDDQEADEPSFTLYHARLGEGEARAVATEGTAGVPDGWWIPDHSPVSFSEAGTRLLFGTAPRPPAEPEELPEDEQVEVDIWNWKDPLIQTMQLVRADREEERTYQAYASTEDFRVVQLGTLSIPEVMIGLQGEGNLAVANTTTMVKYGWNVSHDGTYEDVYLMDVATGEADLVIEKIKGARASLSDAGEYLTWWDGVAKHYMAMDVNTREVRDISEALPYPVHRELDDHPDLPPPYGVGGWLEGDAGVLIYDRFDIWQVDPSGVVEPRNLTEGVGRENNIEFRYMNLDPDADFIDPTEDVLLQAFHIYTKQDGFYRDRFDGDREPRRLLMDDFRFGSPSKAEDADVLVLTRESFREAQDLWLTDSDFNDMEKISNANPQQAEYSWGDAEIIEWVSNDGTPLQGILIKPEGFDPRNQYPMMVYFYERMSDGLHRYVVPNAGSSVNASFYVSRGYVFFQPDIPYEIGHPGESAIDAVVPGVLKIVDQGYIDRDRIGAQGHSWGGYQLAYMVTRSNLFAAVEAGAPVSNMTSAYGGIRWQSGMNRQFQYERTQSRIGGSLWEETLRYINNSPLFEADKVQTPVLMLHNDEDGAVPWYQGIEYYMALRRLQKPVWLVNYNGEPHGVRKTQNRKDWAIRMQQFFDHYLKDAPAPVWMTEGVPAVMKGKTLGLELVDGEDAERRGRGGN